MLLIDFVFAKPHKPGEMCFDQSHRKWCLLSQSAARPEPSTISFTRVLFHASLRCRRFSLSATQAISRCHPFFFAFWIFFSLVAVTVFSLKLFLWFEFTRVAHKLVYFYHYGQHSPASHHNYRESTSSYLTNIILVATEAPVWCWTISLDAWL